MSSEGLNPQPALEQLHQEQKAVIEEGMKGFDTWWGAIEWYHDVQTYSLGIFPNDAMTDVLVAPASLDFQLIFNGDTIGPDHPMRYQYAEQYLQPAFKKSIKFFWKDVTEYGEGGPDPDAESLIALRPSIQTLHDKQRDVLERMAEGFDSHEELHEWGSDLSRAALGENSGELVRSGTQPFLGILNPTREDAERHRITRYRAIATHVLPWFGTAMNKQAKAAKEQPEEKERELEEYELGEELLGDDTRDGRR